jgi:orotate phosphoribosyltransferase
MHPPDPIMINDIIEEIRALNTTIKNFKIHPIPLLRYLPEENDVSLDWLGVYNEEDKKKLNDLLFEQYSLSLSDFIDPSNIKGNIITTDNFGNVNGLFPNREILTKYYQLYTANLVNDAIQSNDLLKSNGLYLCNGNYYQNEFLQMSELLDNSIYRDVLASALYEQISISIIRDKNIGKENSIRYLHNSKQTQFKGKDKELKYIAVTSSSHKILKSFFQQGYIYKNSANENIKDAPYIKFDNYLDIETNEKIELLDDNTEYIILCDAISTGNLVNRLNDLIQGKENSELLYIATFVSNLDPEFENTNEFVKEYSLKLISLLDLPIKKHRVNDLKDEDFKKSLIRINPFTNLPIEFKEGSSLIDSILIKDNLEFLGYLEDKDINIRFEIHNNLIHPYYFNIGSILEKENLKIQDNQLTESLVYDLFVEKKKFDFTNGNCVVFYPKDSGVDFLNKNEFNSKITANHTIRFYELERFPTESGWKFPHSSTYFQEVIEATPNVLIIDDGTCSGNSLYQMINEISYFEPKKIDLLCIVSRIDDYKREFLSRLKRLRKHTKDNEEIDVNILYGAQWHIPTFYQNENPYSDEIKWLNQILELRNTPLFIRKNASKILETIDPKTNKKSDYKYFPKDRLTKEIPKKDILLTRNEIGKIAGYRFYKESFKWYNDITFKKRKGTFTDKTENRQIELLSMCLLYEPYLYPTISKSFPDIRLHLEQFVENIFFKIDGKRINLDTDLFYDWTGNKKDLIHLFFIVYKNNNLYSFIEKHDNLLESFLLFAGENNRALNYILYKLSFYFPINGNSRMQPPQIVKNSIQHLLSKYPSIPDANINFVEKVKRFKHFTTSLVSIEGDDSFENSKSKIENYFNQINNPDYHKVGLNNDKSLILAHFRDIVKCIDENQDYEDHLILLKDKLFENLYPYVNQILSFSKTYRQYLIVDDDYNNLNIRENSLRNLLSVLDEIVLDNTKIQFKDGRDTILRIYSKFFDEKFFLYKTFKDQTTKDVISLIKLSIDNFTFNHSSFRIDSNIDTIEDDLCINMPFRYTKIIIEELVNNFRHSTEAKLTISIDEEYLLVEVISKKTTIKSSGTNSGFTIFKNLQNNQFINCDCVIDQSDSSFHQVLKFKLL